MRSIIFLDIDGVLLPTSFVLFMEQLERLSRGDACAHGEGMEHFAPYCVQNIKELLRRTGAAIVFSSNRKNEMSALQLQALWEDRVSVGTVVGCTPTLDNQQHIRGEEIRQWLAANPTDAYVIIDDMDPSQFHAEQHARLVQCDEKLGFTASALRRALELLA